MSDLAGGCFHGGNEAHTNSQAKNFPSQLRPAVQCMIVLGRLYIALAPYTIHVAILGSTL